MLAKCCSRTGTHELFPRFHAANGNAIKESFMRTISAAALGCAIAAGFASAAYAQGYAPSAPTSPMYIQLDAGASMFDTNMRGLTNNFDTGWSINGHLGRYMSRVFRTELELGYEEANTDQPGLKGTVSNFDIMANGLMDIPTQSSFTPYLGVGVGGARINADISQPSVLRSEDSEWAFAYQGIAGVDWHLTPRTALGVRYRYLDAQPVHVAGFHTDHNSGLASAGLKFTF